MFDADGLRALSLHSRLLKGEKSWILTYEVFGEALLLLFLFIVLCHDRHKMRSFIARCGTGINDVISIAGIQTESRETTCLVL